MSIKKRPSNKLIEVIIILSIIFMIGGFIGSIVEDRVNGDKSNIPSSQVITSDKENSTEGNKDKISEINNKAEEIGEVPKLNEEVSKETKVTSGELKIHFIDVGQADSILIENNGEAMLIDAGNNADSDLVVNYIKDNNIKNIKYAIGTHPHEDHIGGLDKVIDNFHIETLYMPKATATTKTFKNVVTSAKNKGLSFTAPKIGEMFNLGGTTCTILAPNSESYEEVNDNSIVIRLQYGDTSFLFTGDAEELSEDEILNRGFDVKSTVLKVGHHGSDSSTSDKFLAAVNPDYAVIEVGKDNDYGHPRQSIMDKLKSKGIKVYRTDEQGSIIATSDGTTVKFNVEPGSYKGLTKGK